MASVGENLAIIHKKLYPDSPTSVIHNSTFSMNVVVDLFPTIFSGAQNTRALLPRQMLSHRLVRYHILPKDVHKINFQLTRLLHYVPLVVELRAVDLVCLYVD